MRSLLILILIIAGILFVGSVMLMTPKGGLGMGIAGVGGGNEYGSKKSVETTLKKVAIVSSLAFVVVSLFLPYVG
ncbi:MAG: preprotein translocase subunit SecG [Candidatus Peribacteria bacterium]|nr:MAG: preprotein translocase subunit SecG [Candidatus Peribacteria bacterium]